MTFCRNVDFKMLKFLQNVRRLSISLLRNSSSTQCLHLVLGNEAADLDSALSALVYAWYLSQLVQPCDISTTFVPVINIPCHLFRLRTETVHLLKKFEVSETNLIFRDDLDLQQLLRRKKSKLKLTLVDHHVLERSYQALESHVTEIIDHRPKTKNFSSCFPAQIEPVGSCCTLIGERILTDLDHGKIKIDKEDWDMLVYILSAPILLDTVNMSKEAGKVTDRDVQVIDKLWINKDKKLMQKFYDEMSQAKYAADGLNAEELLLKDPKQIESSDGKVRVMFSTLHATLQNFLEREDVAVAITSVLSDNKCHAMVALAPVVGDEENKPFKPVLVYSEHEELRIKIAEALQNADDPRLEMKVDEPAKRFSDNVIIRMYNVRASRKQILPVVVDVI